MQRPPALLLSSIFLLLSAIPVDAQFKLKTLQTRDLRLVYYDEEHEYVIPHLASCFENSMAFHCRLFDYTPNEPVTVLLQDFDDYGFAGASTIPINYLTIGIEPFEYVYETSPTNERINWVMSHELLHIVASDQSSPLDRFFRRLFLGKVAVTDEAPVSMLYSYLTSPRRYAPRWYHEGAAVFMETWMAGGYGRALGGYDEMVFRTMVRDASYFYDLVGLESEGRTIDFQIGQVSYLYGTRFMSYVAYRYGPEKLVQWLKRTRGTKGYYASQFKRVFGTNLDSEWRRWIEWEHEWQRTNLDSIGQYTTTAYRTLSRRPLGSVSRAFYDPGKRRLLTAVNYRGEFAHIASIQVDRWEIDKIAEVATPALYYVASLAFDDSTNTLFYTTQNSRQWRDLNAVDVETRRSRLLIKDTRTGDLAFNRSDGSLWGVQHHNGISRLVRFPRPYKYWNHVLTLPYGRDIFDLDISPDGRYLTASLIEVSGRQRLIRMVTEKLLMGEGGYEVLYEFEKNSPANFVYSPDGRYLFGTTYYTGVSNVFRYDFERQTMEAITNCETGYFRPVPVSDDSLIVFQYSGKGFVPVMVANRAIEDVSAIRFLGQAIVEAHPVVKDWMLGSPAEIDIDSLTIAAGDYSGIRNIELGTAYPIVEAYKNYTAVGLRLDFMEPVGTHELSLSASYTPSKSLPDDEKAHAALRYRHWPWEITSTYNRADFYDLFGPTKTSRKGYSLGLKYSGILVNDHPRRLGYSISVAGYGGLERLPDYQNVAASFDEYLAAGAELNYRSLQRTIGSVEPEKGKLWQANVQTNYVNAENFPRIYTSYDHGFALPWNHWSVWLRMSTGYSLGDRDNVFANFYFGGFGNNWVDRGEEKRYRQYYSFPGIELNDLGGTNYGKLMIDWSLPPIRFKRLGLPTLYCNWAHPTLFSTLISTNYDNLPIRRTLVDVGGQIDFKTVIFSGLSATFSLGYAAAFEKDHRPRKEFMISLKIL